MILQSLLLVMMRSSCAWSCPTNLVPRSVLTSPVDTAARITASTSCKVRYHERRSGMQSACCYGDTRADDQPSDG